MASEYSKKLKSVGANLNDINSKISTISKVVSTTLNGTLDNSIDNAAISPNSITNDEISSGSITADKLDISSVLSPNSNQRIPAPLNSVEYWKPVLLENSAIHTEPYFKDVKIRNVSVDSYGLTFSPERATPVAITYAQLENGIVTLTTNVAHDYEIFDTVHISNLPSPFDGIWTISEVPSSTTLCYQLSQFNELPVNYKIDEEIAGTVSLDSDIKMVVSKSCINGVASLSLQNMFDFTDTTNQDDNSFAGHGYEVGYIVEVNGLGSPYDGSHIITEVPENQPSIFKYKIADRQIDNFSTAIPLVSAFGDGSNILYVYDNDVNAGSKAPLNFNFNEPVTITGFTDTGYNITTGQNGVGAITYVGPNSFTVAGTYDTLSTVETAGSPQVILAHVKVDAEARLFLTGKNKVPDSRSISVSWVTDGNPIDMYFVCWLTSQKGLDTEPRLIKIDETLDVSISKLQGVNNYYWEIPSDIEYYSLLAEVLPGSNSVLLKEAYVFEAIGDQDQKTEHIIRVSITNNVATIYTATTHPYQEGDIVRLFGVESANSALVGTSYEISSVPNDALSFTVDTIGLNDTDDFVAVSGTVIGGYKKDAVSSISPSGLSINSDLGQSINLTDTPTDNYLALTSATAETVASISSAGAGTFKTLDADSLSLDTDIAIRGNTALIGSFIDSRYNGKTYGGDLLNRLARGTIYQASWLVPTTNIPANTMYYGLAAGSFKLSPERLYQVFVSASGMRANPNAACAFEIMLSTTPMRVDDVVDLAHMAYVLPKPIYGMDSVPSSGTINVNSSTTSLYASNDYWRDLQGHFYSISPTPTGTNTTTFNIAKWQRYSNGNALITVDSSAAGKYIQSTINANSHMYIGVNISSTVYGPYINGTYEVTKQSNTTYLIDTTNTTAVSEQDGQGNSLGSITLVDPIMTNTKATFNRTSVVATSDGINHTYNLENLFQKGQLVDVTSTNNYWTVTGSIVSATSSAFVITPLTGEGSVAISKTGLVATLSTSNNQVLLTSGNTDTLLTGQYLYKTSGTGVFGNSGNVYITSITNSTHFTVSTNHSTAGSINFNASGVLPNTYTNTATTTAEWTDRQVQLHKNYLPYDTDLYYVVRLRHGSSTFDDYKITVSENPNGMLAVTDLGQAKEVTFVAQSYANGAAWTSGLPIGYKNVVSTTTTFTIVDTQDVLDSDWWNNYGSAKNRALSIYANRLYQGNIGSVGGTWKSATLFPSFNFEGRGGIVIKKLEVYLRNRGSYNSNGLTVYLAAHTSPNLNTLPTATVSCPVYTTNFTKGQGKWVVLPSSWFSTFYTGGGRGILIGVTNAEATPDTYYSQIDNTGFFDGKGAVEPPKIRITYTYKASIGSNNNEGGGDAGGGGTGVVDAI